MAAALILDCHGHCLRMAAEISGQHFQGLSVVGRRLRLPSHLCKKLQRLDAAAALVRHITAPSVKGFLLELRQSLAASAHCGDRAAEDAPSDSSAPSDGMNSSEMSGGLGTGVSQGVPPEQPVVRDLLRDSEAAWFDMFSDGEQPSATQAVNVHVQTDACLDNTLVSDDMFLVASMAAAQVNLTLDARLALARARLCEFSASTLMQGPVSDDIGSLVVGGVCSCHDAYVSPADVSLSDDEHVRAQITQVVAQFDEVQRELGYALSCYAEGEEDDDGAMLWPGWWSEDLEFLALLGAHASGECHGASYIKRFTDALACANAGVSRYKEAMRLACD
mmetsp:Transcript_102803/g.296004  ORF Transcript_102803/g.296004 Transcript_102803/m.296004 type:complete len:334 (+) Transcript_102803:84-1085(+)